MVFWCVLVICGGAGGTFRREFGQPHQRGWQPHTILHILTRSNTKRGGVILVKFTRDPSVLPLVLLPPVLLPPVLLPPVLLPPVLLPYSAKP